jgi:hypothetical protein
MIYQLLHLCTAVAITAAAKTITRPAPAPKGVEGVHFAMGRNASSVTVAWVTASTFTDAGCVLTAFIIDH